MVVARSWGRVKWELSFTGCKYFIIDRNNLCKWMMVITVQEYECISYYWIIYLKVVNMAKVLWSVFYTIKEKIEKKRSWNMHKLSNMSFRKTMNLHWWPWVYNYWKYSRNLHKINRKIVSIVWVPKQDKLKILYSWDSKTLGRFQV